ncbi:MAG: NAD(P)/FAD-dependent oxidoreductase [Candidatus Heimdallarchaeota archaeon]|nr:NAD(P)/FAD-dependent oxidoreductase [Candidatus Heimdallarchaeota archaeon]MCK4771227.1 NAD(P)/FAD-dependent oxidoreductase [Candidatus Heimdallarchaeota archaeon]
MLTDKQKKEKSTIYDVCIVGAGPGGSSTAYYLAKQGKKVVLLEKEKFPRRKICGDAVSQRAQMHLERMGVLQEILEEKKGRWAAVGGLVSPRRIEYIGNSAQEIGSHLMISIKREILDEKIARAAVREGAELIEEYNVKTVKFSEKRKEWSIKAFEKERDDIKAKVLVAADGAVSKIARSVGVIDSPPDAVCSSVYVEAGTHAFEEDGVCIYNHFLVPGYAAIFKEADDDLVFCCYIIPGGFAKTTDLQNMHINLLQGDPYVVRAMGPKAKIEKIKSAPLRLGGVKKSYSDHFLVVGDAAGHIDPLTGEGIQYAMDAGEIAANVLIEAFEQGNLNEKALKRYQNLWMKSFGRDFKWSTRMVKVLANRPIFLDAFAYLCQKKGPKYLVRWAKIMTGSQPKLSFFLPNLSLPLLFTAIKLSMSKRK